MKQKKLFLFTILLPLTTTSMEKNKKTLTTEKYEKLKILTQNIKLNKNNFELEMKDSYQKILRLKEKLKLFIGKRRPSNWHMEQTEKISKKIEKEETLLNIMIKIRQSLK